jgi:hypothetical protein
VVAADGRLDQAGTIAIAAARQWKECMARVVAEKRRNGRGVVSRALAADSAPHRFPNDLPQLVFPHDCTSTLSMIPTIAASTGAAFRPSVSPAARPSTTTSTFS